MVKEVGWCAARHLQRSSRVLTRKLLSVLTARRREAGNGQAHYMPGAENVSPTRGRGGGTGWLRKRAKSMPIHLGRVYRPGHSRMLDDLRDDKNRAFPVSLPKETRASTTITLGHFADLTPSLQARPPLMWHFFNT